MSPGEGKFGLCMVKLCPLPIGRCVATIALSRDVCLSVIRVLGSLVVRHVTTETVFGSSFVPASLVAAITSRTDMCSRQCKPGLVVVESDSLPLLRIMTDRAIFREIGSHMVGIRCSVIVLGMASKTIPRGSFKLLSFVTRSAIQLSMRSDQSKSGYLRMVEFRSLPSIHSVASLTGQREMGAGMIRRSRALIVLQMTRHTVRAETDVDSRGSLWMAEIAVDGSMCPQQGKSVEMITD